MNENAYLIENFIIQFRLFYTKKKFKSYNHLQTFQTDFTRHEKDIIIIIAVRYMDVFLVKLY